MHGRLAVANNHQISISSHVYYTNCSRPTLLPRTLLGLFWESSNKRLEQPTRCGIALFVNHSDHNALSRSVNVRARHDVFLTANQNSEQVARIHFEGNVHKIILCEDTAVSSAGHICARISFRVLDGWSCDGEEGVMAGSIESAELRRSATFVWLSNLEVVRRSCKKVLIITRELHLQRDLCLLTVLKRFVSIDFVVSS